MIPDRNSSIFGWKEKRSKIKEITSSFLKIEKKYRGNHVHVTTFLGKFLEGIQVDLKISLNIYVSIFYSLFFITSNF